MAEHMILCDDCQAMVDWCRDIDCDETSDHYAGILCAYCTDAALVSVRD